MTTAAGAMLTKMLLTEQVSYSTSTASRAWQRCHFKCLMSTTARLITKEDQVKKWLATFSNLKIIRMEDNIQAKPPNGALYKRFQAKAQSLPSNQRKTCLAFHGSSAQNVTSICQNGYDPKLRGRQHGQAYGTGEYFATTPDISMGYCCSAKKMIVNELLLGQSGVHHTQSGNIIVMKDPDHELPRFIITFKWIASNVSSRFTQTVCVHNQFTPTCTIWVFLLSVKFVYSIIYTALSVCTWLWKTIFTTEVVCYIIWHTTYLSQHCMLKLQVCYC